MVAETMRMAGCLVLMPGLQHTLVACRRALAVHARSKLPQRRSGSESKKLSLEAGQLNDLPAVFIRQ